MTPATARRVDPDADAPAAAEPPANAPAMAATPWARRLAGNLAWNVVSELAARGASLGLALACARTLTVAGFGRFSYALALVQYVWLAADAAANSGYATREVVRVRANDPHRARRLKGHLLRMRLAGAGALTAGMAIVLLVAPLAPDLRAALAGASLFFLAYAAFPDWALRAREDFRGLAAANAAAALATVLGAVFVLGRWPGPGTAAAVWAGSFAVAAAVGLARIARARAIAWDGADAAIGQHARRSIVFAIGSIAGIGCAQAPMLMVGAIASPTEAGIFGASSRWLLLVINAFSVLWWPLLPVLVHARSGGRAFRDALATVGSAVLALGLPIAIAFALWPRELLALAFGERYGVAATALRISAFAVPLFAVTALLEQTALAIGAERARAWVNTVALAAQLVLGSFLVPAWGAAGAAASMVATYAISAALYVWSSRHDLPWRDLGARIGGPIALNVALLAGWLGARALHVPALPAIGVATVAYLAIAWATGMLPGRAMLRGAA